MQGLRPNERRVQVRYRSLIAEHWANNFVCAENGGSQHWPRQALANHEGGIQRIDHQTAPGSAASVVAGGKARGQIRPTGHTLWVL